MTSTKIISDMSVVSPINMIDGKKASSASESVRNRIEIGLNRVKEVADEESEKIKSCIEGNSLAMKAKGNEVQMLVKIANYVLGKITECAEKDLKESSSIEAPCFKFNKLRGSEKKNMKNYLGIKKSLDSYRVVIDQISGEMKKARDTANKILDEEGLVEISDEEKKTPPTRALDSAPSTEKKKSEFKWSTLVKKCSSTKSPSSKSKFNSRLVENTENQTYTENYVNIYDGKHPDFTFGYNPEIESTVVCVGGTMFTIGECCVKSNRDYGVVPRAKRCGGRRDNSSQCDKKGCPYYHDPIVFYKDGRTRNFMAYYIPTMIGKMIDIKSSRLNRDDMIVIRDIIQLAGHMFILASEKLGSA